MARRHNLLSPTAWLVSLVGIAILVAISYFWRVAVIEGMAERQINRMAAAQQKIQAQQQARKDKADQAAANALKEKREQMAEEVQAMRQRADLENRHNAAWSAFYIEPAGCDNWKNDQHMVECVNHKIRAKSEFERKWAAGEIAAPQG